MQMRVVAIFLNRFPKSRESVSEVGENRYFSYQRISGAQDKLFNELVSRRFIS